MRPKDDHKEVLIRQKAIEMIVREGFDGLSMHKLARAVNISVSTIYVYFQSREQLLTRLFIEIQNQFEQDTLQGFSPTLDLEKGLWLQWINRFKNIRRDPTAFLFHEQFRNSPLIDHADIPPGAFRQSMIDFFENLTTSRQIQKMTPEIFWAVAYGPFYTLVRFHLANASMSGATFTLTENKLRSTFGLVVAALQNKK